MEDLSRAGPREPATIIARLSLLALGATATWINQVSVGQSLFVLAGAYLLLTILLFLFASRQAVWLACLGAVIDVAAITSLVGITGGARVPLWVLYLFPLGAAGAAGLIPALVGSSLVLAGYAFMAASDLLTATPAAWWPPAVLATAAVLVAALPSRWLVEWREKRVWEQVAWAREIGRREAALVQATGQMLATFEPGHVHAAVVRTAHEALHVEARLVDTISGQQPDGMAEPPPDRTMPLTDRLALSLPRSDQPLQQQERDWLQRLAGFAKLALTRCALHNDLRAEEHRLRTMWEMLPAPAVLWGPEGNALLANSAYRALDLPVGLLETQEELTVADPPRTFVIVQSQLLDSGCRLALLREVTRERQELLAKDEFLSLVGHELRTPLTSIHGFSQMIDRNLSVIKQQVGQLDRLINDLSTESSSKGGTLSLDLQGVDLAELARGIAERFKGSYLDRTLELDIKDVAPVNADPARLIQVVDNLLNNAVKYSPPDGSIRVRVGMRDGHVVLGVQDQGVGIASEHLPQLFDRFYRVPDAHTERVKGLGLGLSIVRDLVVAHGGRVWAESQGPGRGSTFWVSLPAVPAAPAG